MLAARAAGMLVAEEVWARRNAMVVGILEGVAEGSPEEVEAGILEVVAVEGSEEVVDVAVAVLQRAQRSGRVV